MKELSNERINKWDWISGRQAELFNIEINDLPKLPS